jgi:hypothetical protein
VRPVPDDTAGGTDNISVILPARRARDRLVPTTAPAIACPDDRVACATGPDDTAGGTDNISVILLRAELATD